MNDITRILQELATGDPDAADRLWAAVYAEMRAFAAAQVAHELAELFVLGHETPFCPRTGRRADA